MGTGVWTYGEGRDGLGTRGLLNGTVGGVNAGTAVTVSGRAGVKVGVVGGEAAVVAAGLAVSPRLGRDGVGLGVKVNCPGEGEASDTGLGDSAAGDGTGVVGEGTGPVGV